MAVRWEAHIAQAMQRHTGSAKAPAPKAEEQKPENVASQPGAATRNELIQLH